MKYIGLNLSRINVWWNWAKVRRHADGSPWYALDYAQSSVCSEHQWSSHLTDSNRMTLQLHACRVWNMNKRPNLKYVTQPSSIAIPDGWSYIN